MENIYRILKIVKKRTEEKKRKGLSGMRGLHRNIVSEAENFVVSYEKLVNREEKNRRIYENLKDRHSYSDRLIVDLTHELEFEEDYTVEEQLELYKKLKGAVEMRRKAKDRLDFYVQVMNFYKRGGTEKQFEYLESKIDAMITAKQNRKYKKRVKESEAV